MTSAPEEEEQEEEGEEKEGEAASCQGERPGQEAGAPFQAKGLTQSSKHPGLLPRDAEENPRSGSRELGT